MFCAQLLPLALSASGAPSIDITGMMETAVKQTQGDMFAIIGVVIPAIIAVVGASVAISFGIKWLKSMKKNS